MHSGLELCISSAKQLQFINYRQNQQKKSLAIDSFKDYAVLDIVLKIWVSKEEKEEEEYFA